MAPVLSQAETDEKIEELSKLVKCLWEIIHQQGEWIDRCRDREHQEAEAQVRFIELLLQSVDAIRLRALLDEVQAYVARRLRLGDGTSRDWRFALRRYPSNPVTVGHQLLQNYPELLWLRNSQSAMEVLCESSPIIRAMGNSAAHPILCAEDFNALRQSMHAGSLSQLLPATERNAVSIFVNRLDS